MYLGLIVPSGLFGLPALALYCLGVPMLALSAWLSFNLRGLWQGRGGAWMTGLSFFLLVMLVAGAVFIAALKNEDRQTLLWSAAALSHAGVTLVCLFSLKTWIDRAQWIPARDPLAEVDKRALASKMRARPRERKRPD